MNVTHLCIIIEFEKNLLMSFLCIMKLILLSALAIICLLSSCTSEYEERLLEARKLKAQLSLIEESNFISPKPELIMEISELEAEIHYLAKVSGDEAQFMSDLFE